MGREKGVTYKNYVVLLGFKIDNSGDLLKFSCFRPASYAGSLLFHNQIKRHQRLLSVPPRISRPAR